jgi:hypothetical protein
MNYLELGFYFATISVIIAIYYSIKLNSPLWEDLINWWNGEFYYFELILLNIFLIFAFSLAFFIIVLVGYPVIIIIATLLMIVISQRNKRLNRTKNQK